MKKAPRSNIHPDYTPSTLPVRPGYRTLSPFFGNEENSGSPWAVPSPPHAPRRKRFARQREKIQTNRGVPTADEEKPVLVAIALAYRASACTSPSVNCVSKTQPTRNVP